MTIPHGKSLLHSSNDIQYKAEEESSKEYYYRVSELKATLPTKNRCVICTLPIPCNHYSSLSDMPVPQLPEPIVSEESEDLGFFPKLQPAKEKSFTIRYKGRSEVFDHAFTNKSASVPSSKRLQLAQKVEAYREEKIKKEIEKIRQQRERETEREREAALQDKKRRKRAVKLKATIGMLKEDYLMRQQQIKLYLQEERRRKDREEDRRKRDFEVKRKELEEFKRKREMEKQKTRTRHFILMSQ